jgi:flagellar hook-associated protein 3 FlgL
MTTTSFSRISTANTFDNARSNLLTRQTNLSNLQENLTSGKRVVVASDDPTAAAQAERALTRITRIATDQRALEAQRNSIASAESTLGDISDALQKIRELVVSAGNGAYTPTERKAIGVQIASLRDQVFSLANRTDSNGLPLFSALGSALAPLVGPTAQPTDYTFQGLPGQSASTEVSIPFSLNGDSAFMNLAPKEGVVPIAVVSGASASTLQANNVSVSNTSLTNGSNYSINIDSFVNTAATGTTPAFNTLGYTLTDSTTGSTVGSYTATDLPSVTTTGTLQTGELKVTNAGLANGSSYAITIDSVDTTTSPGNNIVGYTITETPNVGGPYKKVGVTYPAGGSFTVGEMPGLSLTLSGTPAAGDTVSGITNPKSFNISQMPGLSMNLTGTPVVGDKVTVNAKPSIFGVLDDAVKGIGAATDAKAAAKAVSRALNNIDVGMARIAGARGQAGALLVLAERITANQEKRSIQLEGDRSRAEDLDMIKGISDFNNQQTGYQAALQSYASIQKLSLFNFIS